MRPYLYFLRLFAHAGSAFFKGTLAYPFMDEAGRNQYVQKWSRKLLDICSIKVKVTNPELLSSRALIVANHVSWLDIFLIYSVVPGHFIAKADMASWPLIGWLAKKTGTLFLERNSSRHLKNTLDILVENLKAKERCIFFPEGTTGTQGKMLPFHANLFEGAINAELPVQPFAIRYINQEGQYETAIDCSGNINLVQSMKNVFTTDHILAELTILPVIESIGMHRKVLSQQARETITSVLPNYQAP